MAIVVKNSNIKKKKSGNGPTPNTSERVYHNGPHRTLSMHISKHSLMKQSCLEASLSSNYIHIANINVFKTSLF